MKSRSKLGCIGCHGTLVLGGMVSVGVAAVVCIVGAVAAWQVYDEHVVREPEEHLERARIMSAIAQESTVYYADGRTRIDGRRLRLTDKQRRLLAVKGKVVGRKILAQVAGIVTPDTLLRWYRQLVARKYDGSKKRGRGRPLDERGSR